MTPGLCRSFSPFLSHPPQPKLWRLVPVGQDRSFGIVGPKAGAPRIWAPKRFVRRPRPKVWARVPAISPLGHPKASLQPYQAFPRRIMPTQSIPKDDHANETPLLAFTCARRRRFPPASAARPDFVGFHRCPKALVFAYAASFASAARPEGPVVSAREMDVRCACGRGRLRPLASSAFPEGTAGSAQGCLETSELQAIARRRLPGCLHRPRTTAPEGSEVCSRLPEGIR